MKLSGKILSLLLAAVLALAIAVPGAAPLKAQAASMTWYTKGDLDFSGAVQAADARNILRIAAYIDPVPSKGGIRFDAADVDGDGTVTSRDARKAVRIAGKLESAPSINAKAAALTRILDINALKDAPEDGYNKHYDYTKTDTTYGAVKIKAGLSFTGTALKSMQEDIAKKQTTKDKLSTDYYTAYGYLRPQYFNYLPVMGDKTVVFPDGAAAGLVKSTSFTSNSDGTYSVKIVFNDFTITKNKENATQLLMEKIFPDIHDSEQLKEMGSQLSESMGGTEDDEVLSVEIHDSIKFRTTTIFEKDDTATYRFQNAVTNPTVEYKFNADGYPVSAAYTAKQAITIPATLTLGISSATFAMTSYEEMTCSYVFSVVKNA